MKAMRQDVWSLGVLLWEVMVGNVPWRSKSRQQLCVLAVTSRTYSRPNAMKFAPCTLYVGLRVRACS
jgi:hypothetical protein